MLLLAYGIAVAPAPAIGGVADQASPTVGNTLDTNAINGLQQGCHSKCCQEYQWHSKEHLDLPSLALPQVACSEGDGCA